MTYGADEYRIVPATWRDLFAVQRLERAAFQGDAYSWFELLALLAFPGMVNLKAVNAANRLVGYVAGDPHPSQGCAWIVTIAVDAAHRRRGLGRRLLKACEDTLPMRLIRLTVRANNEAAIALYRQCGYQEQSVRRSYYRDGKDGVVMEKEKRHREH